MKAGVDDDMVTNVLFLLLFYDILLIALMRMLVRIYIECIGMVRETEENYLALFSTPFFIRSFAY